MKNSRDVFIGIVLAHADEVHHASMRPVKAVEARVTSGVWIPVLRHVYNTTNTAVAMRARNPILVQTTEARR